MVTVEWFGTQFQASWIALIVVIAVIFLVCAGAALVIRKAAGLRVGAITMALGGGLILFALIVAGGIWFGYHTLGSSQ